MSATMNRLSKEKQTSRSSSANSAMPIVLDGAWMRNGNLRRITSVMLSKWSEISQSTRRRVLTWLLLWQTWTDSLILLGARASDPVYAHTQSPRWDRQPPYSKGSKPSPTQRSLPTRLISVDFTTTQRAPS